MVDTQDRAPPLPSCHASRWPGSEGITHLCFIAGELWPQGKAWPLVWLSVYNASQTRSGWRRRTLGKGWPVALTPPALASPSCSSVFSLRQRKVLPVAGRGNRHFQTLEAVAWCRAHPLLRGISRCSPLRPAWEVKTQLSSFWGSSLWLLRR